MQLTKIKFRLKQTAMLAICSAMLTTPVNAGLPVIDYTHIAQNAMNWALDAADRAATLANWVTQLENWKQNLANLVRGQMQKIIGKELMEQRETQQIKRMFAQRKQKCDRLTNASSQGYCKRTVELEERKYEELQAIDKLVQKTFDESINDLIAAQNRTATSNTGSGQTQTAENSVIARLQQLNNEIAQRQNKIKSIDELIAQYHWIRKNLAKDQLSGNGGNTLSKAAGAAMLQRNASKYRNDAAALRQKSSGISNRF